MPNIDLSILNQRQTPAFYASSLATRPAFGFAGRIFIDTDSPSTGLYRDTGAAWVQIADPGAGTTGTLQQVTTNGNTTSQGITITAGGLSSNIVTIAANSIGSTANYIGQTMATNDYWKIYGNAQSIIDTGELVFEIGDNGTSSAVDRFRYTIYDGASLVYKDLLTLDYDESIYNTNLIVSSGKNLGVGVTVPSGLIHADGGASAARMIIDADNGIARIFSFRTDNLPRWALRVDGTETGLNVGGDFSIRRYDDTGAFVDAPLSINRSTGQSTFAKKVVIENNAGDQQLQIVSTSAPSLRFDNLQTGATKRAGLGISTATNNFIQGSADRDFCIFNGSTAAASPILFGIYDAAAVNVQEAARISPARNFLIGTTTDAGQKLQISGTALITSSLTARTSVTGSGTNASPFYDEGIIFGPSTNQSKIQFGNSFNSSDGTSLKFVVNSNTGANTSIDVMTLLYNGNVGIGTTNGDIFSTANATNILGVQATGTNQGGLIDISATGTGFSGINIGTTSIRRGGIYSLNGSALAFYTNPTNSGNSLSENARFTNSGNLLIGTTTDAGFKLAVNGTSQFSGKTNIVNSIADYTFTVVNTDSTGYGMYLQAGNTNNAIDVFNAAGTTQIFKVTGTGGILTGAPSGGSAGTWKLGTFTSGAAVQGGTVRVEINGVAYDLLTT